jgi:protein phosphatase
MKFLQRLFSQPQTEPKPKPLAHREEVPDDGRDEQPTPQTGDITRLAPGLHVGKLSDIGQERDRNEDTLFLLEAQLQHEYGQESFGLFIVADGMGGHQKGELASSVAARTAANHILKDVYLPYLINNNDPSVNRPINEALTSAVEEANLAVQQAAPESGTTLTMALVMGNNAYIAHVGDTRAYLFKDGELKQITKDHSLAQRLEEAGQMTSSEAAHVQNVLYRALGQNSAVEVDTYIQNLPPASSLLLCSDGLWGLMDKTTLREIIANSNTPQEACQQLTTVANQNGGPDNITSIMVTMGVEQ